MDNNLISHIAESFRESTANRLLLIQNPDGFLKRPDVIQALSKKRIRIFTEEGISIRVDFELVFKKEENQDVLTVYFIQSIEDVLEDIRQSATYITFHLSDYLSEYHFESIKSCSITELDYLFSTKPLVKLNKNETERFLAVFHSNVSKASLFDIGQFREGVQSALQEQKRDLKGIVQLVSAGLEKAIGTKDFEEVLTLVNQVNLSLQQSVLAGYKQSINSSYIKRPPVVSRILNYLAQNYKDQKVALLVIDGMAYWQYLMLKEHLDNSVKLTEDVIYSWIPSITQLSRQAIFRGGIPDPDYIQNPQNEEKLWRAFWRLGGFAESQLKYSHDAITDDGLHAVSKFAQVFTGLDIKMHSSSDYKDLKDLTRNWINSSNVLNLISRLLSEEFDIFLTADHGNVQAKAWRNLKSAEKLGTAKSGSRSKRHLEYSEGWIADEFIRNNPDLSDSIVREEHAIYFRNDQSFSNSPIVTHGGSHILEVLVPFIKITNG